jgi:hypothetical protein
MATIKVLQVTPAIYKIYIKRATQVTSFGRSTLSSLQHGHPPNHQYLYLKKLHLYGRGDSHVCIGETMSSPPQ